MSNLPMQSKGLPQIITKEFKSSENEVLTYILSKPKMFKDFTNTDKQKLGVYLVAISTYLGIKETLEDTHRKLLVNTLCDEMPNFTYEELNKAIQMSAMGKFINLDNNHYQHLSPMYLSAMVNAYKTYRANIYQKYQRIQGRIRREKEPEKISDKDMFYIGLDLVDNEFNDYVENTDEYCDSEYRNTQFKHIYDYLTKHKVIGVKKTDDIDELKTYIVSWFKAIHKKETEPRTYICKRFNIPTTK
mgnify:CR=1 FL=1|jgi:hypothetical protein